MSNDLTLRAPFNADQAYETRAKKLNIYWEGDSKHQYSAFDKLQEIEDIGFRFPRGKAFFDGEYAGFVFEDKIEIIPPEGWRIEYHGSPTKEQSFTLHDDKNRLRGRSFHGDAGIALDFLPRFLLDSRITASKDLKKIPKWAEQFNLSANGIYMGHVDVTALYSGLKLHTPFLTYVYPGHYAVPDNSDWKRLDKDMQAIEQAQTYIASEVRALFSGARINTGLKDKETISYGLEAMSYSPPIDGDSFTHWYDNADTDPTAQQIEELKERIKERLCEMLPASNALVLSILPSLEEVQDIENNFPIFIPPAAPLSLAPPSSLVQRLKTYICR